MPRNIHLDGKVYRYVVGKSYVAIRTPEGTKIVAFCSEVAGVTNDTFERGQWKRTSDGMVKPHHVKTYLERLLRV